MRASNFFGGAGARGVPTFDKRRSDGRVNDQSAGLLFAIIRQSLAAANTTCAGCAGAKAIFRRRRHQPRRPALARIRPGKPAPAMGPRTAVIVAENVELPEAVKTNVPPAVAKARRLGRIRSV